MAQATQVRLMETRGAEKDIRDLRTTIDWFRSQGYLVETNVGVDPDLEITGVQKLMDSALPILFNNVKGYPHLRAITNLFANMDMVNKMFGWPDAKARTRMLAHALTHPIPPVEISQSEAPRQEEVITDDLNINKHVPAIRHTALETEMTIGSGNSVVAGEDIVSCFNACTWLEENAKKQLWVSSLGAPRVFSDDEIARVRASISKPEVISKTWDYYVAKGRASGVV